MLDAAAAGIQQGHAELPFGVALFGAKPAPGCGLGEVLLQAVAMRVRTAQDALSSREPLFGRPAIPRERFGAVCFEVAEAGRVHESQVELGVRIPELRGAGELFHTVGLVREARGGHRCQQRDCNASQRSDGCHRSFSPTVGRSNRSNVTRSKREKLTERHGMQLTIALDILHVLGYL